MQQMNRSRIIGLIALFAILFSFCYANFIIEKNNYTPMSDMIENPAKYEGNEVIVNGIARNVNNHGNIIIFELVIEDGFFSVQQDLGIPEEVPGNGDIVFIRGFFHSPNIIVASYVYSITMWERDLVYIRSLPAVIILILLIITYWKFTLGGWMPAEDYDQEEDILRKQNKEGEEDR